MTSSPIYKTNIKTLRFIVDNVFHPISMYFFTKGVKIYFRDKDKIEIMTPRLHRKMNIYTRIYSILDKPYSKWGTTWQMNFSLKEDIDKQEYEIDEIW